MAMDEVQRLTAVLQDYQVQKANADFTIASQTVDIRDLTEQLAAANQRVKELEALTADAETVEDGPEAPAEDPVKDPEPEPVEGVGDPTPRAPRSRKAA